jgi:ABC-type transport system involved in cytochrome c biogenesis permease component
MPYHADALGRSWAEVEPALQTLLGALMDVAGAGWVGIGGATLVLVAVPMRRGERWGRLLIPALFLIFYVPTLLATLAVLNGTPATPPWYGNATACLATMVGVLADAPWRSLSEN